jgi:hypothetical protein
MSQGDFTIEINKRDQRAMESLFTLAPKEISKSAKRRWGKTGRKTVKAMKSSHFTGPTGRRTLKHRTPKKRGDARGKALRPMLAVKKIKFGTRGTFGGYIVMGFKGLHGSKRRTHPLINIFEFTKGGERVTAKGAGRGRLLTRAPLEAAWEGAQQTADFLTDLEEAVVEWLED